MDKYAKHCCFYHFLMKKWTYPVMRLDKRAKGWYLLPMERMSIFIDKEVQRLIDSFAHCFRVKITIFSARMEELIVGLQNPGAGFCRLIQKKLNARYRCLRQDKMMCEQCQGKQELLIYDCYAGFTETVIPIRRPCIKANPAFPTA
jgi:hypothetical protein